LNFALVYGSGAGNYSDRSGLSMSESKKAIKGFYDLYSGAKNYLYGIEDYVLANRSYRTLAGRKIKFHFDPMNSSEVNQMRRNARNYRIQSTSADIIKASLPIIYKNLKGYDADIVNIVHDEIIVETPKAVAKDVQRIVEQGMIAAGQKYLTDVKVDVESAIGDSWSAKK
jgi:DNA polymerase-1